MVILDFSILPLGKGEGVSDFVARSLDIIDRSGLPYRCHATGTTLEGEFDEVFNVVKQCFEATAADCDRVECNIAIDYRRGAESRIESTIAHVEEKLGRPVMK